MTQGLPQTFKSGSAPIPNTTQIVPNPTEFAPQAPEPLGPQWTAPQQAYLDALFKAAAQAAVPGVFSGATGMQDADFVVPQSVLLNASAYIGAQVAFSAPHAFTLPKNPPAGFFVEWADEVTGAAALNGANTLTANTADGTQIQGGPAGQTGGTTLANTYVANAAGWGPGSVIRFFFNGKFWKVA